MSERPLTTKQAAFVREFPVDFNGTQAAIRAGYAANSARQTAFKLLSDPRIQTQLASVVDAVLEPHDASIERIAEELAAVGFTSITDILTWNGSETTIRPSEELTPAARAAIKKISVRTATDPESHVSVTSIRVELHDKLRALERLGEWRKMFGRLAVTGEGFDGYEVEELPIRGVALVARATAPPKPK